MTDHERALEIVVVEPTCITVAKRVRDAYPWCVRIFRFELSRQVTRARAEIQATRVRNLLTAALAAVRTEERERAARIAETHVGSFGGSPDYCAQKIADAIRRQEGRDA